MIADRVYVGFLLASFGLSLAAGTEAVQEKAERGSGAVLESYRRIVEQGGWETVPGGSELREGDRDERVALLRTRLSVSGDLPAFEGEPDAAFDGLITQALLRFQKRHGLLETGILDEPTRSALNVPASQRLLQLEMNQARWLDLPLEPGPRYVLVNIPDFRLTVVEDQRTVLTMKVIVGKVYRRTPSFASSITEVTFFPYWNVPTSIARGEIVPKLQKDPDYLQKGNFEVLSTASGKSTVLDPGSIEWSDFTANDRSYRLRQKPGPKNALGRLKFTIPNSFNVYLHDTPEPALFEKQRRAFSHGCMRIEKPKELAQFVLKTVPEWGPVAVEEALDKGKHQVVRLPEPVPVYIVYWTAWIDGEGVVQFREDLYGRDLPSPASAALSQFEGAEACSGD